MRQLPPYGRGATDHLAAPRPQDAYSQSGAQRLSYAKAIGRSVADAPDVQMTNRFGTTHRGVMTEK